MNTHNQSLSCSFQFLISVLIGIVTGIGLGVISLYFSTGIHRWELFLFYLEQPLILVMNLFPFILLNLLFFFLTNRLWISFSITGFLCLLYSCSNYWKLLARDTPVYAEDLTIVAEAVTMSQQYVTISSEIILAVFVILLISFLLFFIRWKATNKKMRILLFLIVLFLFMPGYFVAAFNTQLYESISTWPELISWYPTTQYVSRGGIYPFVHSIAEAYHRPPSGYKEKDMAKMLNEELPTSSIPADQQVSIICIMLEAFADFSQVTDKITSADPYADYHALQQESYHGTLVPTVFAGGTVETETRVLTGFSNFGQYRKPSWSYARYFTEQGYSASGAHPSTQSFYHRNTTTVNLGLSDYRFLENHFGNPAISTSTIIEAPSPEEMYYLDNTCPEYAYDYLLFSDIYNNFKEQTQSGKSLFSFNVTYQNHGPYYSGLQIFPTEYVPQGNMSLEDYSIINHYLTSVHETSRCMKELADSLRNDESPVVLVFFGDHKPWLGNQSTTYHALGIDISTETKESLMNYYSTDYLIWANDSAKDTLGNDFSGVGPTISPCFLMNVLFDQCGWEGPSYMALTDQIMEKVPVIHNEQYIQEGELVSAEDLSPENVALLLLMKQAEHFLMHDYMN